MSRPLWKAIGADRRELGSGFSSRQAAMNALERQERRGGMAVKHETTGELWEWRFGAGWWRVCEPRRGKGRAA